MLQIPAEISTAGGAIPHRESNDFSLVDGGPLYRLWRRIGLTGDAMQFPHWRVLAAVGLAWVPLMLLSIAEGRAWGGDLALPFLNDVETHVRLLIVVPLLIFAEVRVYRRLPRIVRRFVEHDLIPDAARSRFDAAIASAMRLRDSTVAEFLLVLLVYGVGVLIIRRTQFALDVNTWYATMENGQLRLTPAGWWGALVGVPIVQFLMVRWYYRLLIWARFLWQVSRFDLRLEPAHPDGVAGLHFVSSAEFAYRPVVLALGAALAGMIANKIFDTGAGLLDFKVEIIGTMAVLVFIILGPMLAFTPRLMAVRRMGMEEYSRLGQRYAREFGRKWIHSNRPPAEPLLGSADIQSLADLRNSFLVVKDMHVVPFGMRNAVALALAVLLPVSPLLLTTFSVEQILERVLKVLF